MWSGLQFSANMILPSFLLIAVGFFAVQKNIVSADGMEKVTKLIYRYLLPMKIFINIAVYGKESFSNYKMTLYCAVVTIFVFTVCWAAAKRLIRRKESVSAFVQACIRGSFAAVGLEMIETFSGPEGVARCSLVLALAAILFNILAAIAFSADSEERVSVRKILGMVAANPLIIAGVLGLIPSAFSWRPPFIIEEVLTDLGDLAPPLSLLCLGAGLNVHALKTNLKYSVISSLIKTLISGVIAVTGAVLLGFRGFELTVITIFFAAPNSPTSYIMARVHNADSELAASGVMLSTIMSLFVSMAIIVTLRVSGLI